MMGERVRPVCFMSGRTAAPLQEARANLMQLFGARQEKGQLCHADSSICTWRSEKAFSIMLPPTFLLFSAPPQLNLATRLH